MVTSKRIWRIARLSETAERAAAHALSAALTSVEECRVRLAELKGYRREYARSLTSGSAVRLNGYQAQELRTFIARIDTAIGALERKLEESEWRRDRDRETWAGHLRRTKALRDVADRASNHETRHAETREQREIDDRAAPKKG